MASSSSTAAATAGGQEEVPEGLNLDANGRTIIDGSVCFDFQSFPKALKIPNDDALAQLIADCEAAFTARSIETPTASYSSGSTFFLPACVKPRCKLEELAKSIFDFHTRNVKEFDPSCSGAEWWTLVLDVDSSDDVAFHWDRDYGLEEAADYKLHPHIATVTYLSDEGAPTLVLQKETSSTGVTEEESESEGKEEPIPCGWLSVPRRGKHISFDGKLLHGAPAEFLSFLEPPTSPSEEAKGKKKQQKRPRSKKRVTFLVNVWLNHAPLESEPFPEEALYQLSKEEPEEKNEGSSSSSSPVKRKGEKIEFKAGEAERGTIRPLSFSPSSIPGKDSHALEFTFVEMQRMLHLQLEVVPEEIRGAVADGEDSLSLSFDKESRPLGTLTAGDYIEDDSEEEEESSGEEESEDEEGEFGEEESNDEEGDEDEDEE